MLNIYPLMSDHPAAKKNEMLDIPARKKGMGDMPDPAKDHVGQSFPLVGRTDSVLECTDWHRVRLSMPPDERFPFPGRKNPPLFRRNTGKAHFEEDFPFVQAESKISA
ncbi:MAG: hypothetical protein BAA03_03260 [Caldibacillus debilis]|nr:MAG: hypothetical protein BAA03_03260 [Caldibacillus debilis]